MQIVRTNSELSEALVQFAGPVQFVPTMGALHAGHASLINQAAREREDNGAVVTSIFVNKLQFNDARDYETYPRNESADAKLCEMAGCDLLYVPNQEEIYPSGFGGTTITVKGVSENWEGAHRPGHFDGVATVVSKLFHLVLPDYAYFGEKDWQQCCVIRRMVSDLDIPVWLRIAPTVREEDGLAMSSRNQLLAPEFREVAPQLYRQINFCAEQFFLGVPPRVVEAEAASRLLQSGFSAVDYVAIVNENTLEPVESDAEFARVLAAATLGGVRLIDNLRVIQK